MAAKQYFAICDTETTIEDTVADFAIIICDRKGIIVNQCAVMVKDHFDTKELFYDPKVTGFWGKQAAEARRINYTEMLNHGTRHLASVNAINRWIDKAVTQYNPILTAYNLPFDTSKCANTGIDLTGFSDRFCLWAAAVGNICKTKGFKQFALENHAFNNVTDKGNMTLKTNAEIVAGYISGEFTNEPHTALEDAVYFELPILKHVIAKRKWRDNIVSYDWKKFQVKDHFIAKV